MLTRIAEFSSDRVYRYTLQIPILGQGYVVQFIGLNPSTADETTDDATMRRLKRFAKDWGFGQLIMTNLFAYRSRDPKLMKQAPDPIGPLNNWWLLVTAQKVDMLVCCWGNHGRWLDRDKQVIKLLTKNQSEPLYCFGQSRDGHPLHPLRLAASTQPIRFDP